MAGQTCLGIDEAEVGVGPCAVHLSVGELHGILLGAVTEVVQDVHTVVNAGTQFRTRPVIAGPVAVVQTVDTVLIGRDPHRGVTMRVGAVDQFIQGLGCVLRRSAETEMLTNHLDILRRRVLSGQIPQSLGDKAINLGTVPCRRASDINLRHQVDIATPIAVIRFTPAAVAVVVPDAVQAGEVDVAGHIVLGVAAGTGDYVEILGRDDIVISADYHILDAVGEILVSDVIANIVGAAAADVVGSVNLGQDAGSVVVILQRLERCGQRRSSDNKQIVTTIPARHRHPVTVDRLRIVDPLHHLLFVHFQSAQERRGATDIFGMNDHFKLRVVIKLAGKRQVLHGL